MTHSLTLELIDDARERARAECEEQGLDFAVSDLSALVPIARVINEMIEAERFGSNN
jgi:hypothetical protein